jgi:hypothetical protein
MRCDDRTQMRDAVVHGITMNRNDDAAQQVRLSARSIRPVGDPAD